MRQKPIELASIPKFQQGRNHLVAYVMDSLAQNLQIVVAFGSHLRLHRLLTLRW